MHKWEKIFKKIQNILNRNKEEMERIENSSHVLPYDSPHKYIFFNVFQGG